jgi:uncharacterized protein (TIGR02246 family)
MRVLLLLLTLVAVPALAQTSSQGAATKADPAIVKVADAYVKASLAGDAKAIAALYTEDAVEMPPHHPPVKGRTAIEQHYVKELAEGKLTSFTIQHVESRASGDIGYDVGTYRQSFKPTTGSAVDGTGKYTVILKRMGTDWKVAYAIYNSDTPPRMPSSSQMP